MPKDNIPCSFLEVKNYSCRGGKLHFRMLVIEVSLFPKVAFTVPAFCLPRGFLRLKSAFSKILQAVLALQNRLLTSSPALISMVRILLLTLRTSWSMPSSLWIVPRRSAFPALIKEPPCGGRSGWGKGWEVPVCHSLCSPQSSAQWERMGSNLAIDVSSNLPHRVVLRIKQGIGIKPTK